MRSQCQSQRVCVRVSMRAEWGRGRPGGEHSSVAPLTVANAALTSVVTSVATLLLGRR